MELIAELAECIVDRCRPKQGCSLNLRGISTSQRMVIDCDRYIQRNNYRQQLCDYIIICTSNSTSVSVVEMKSGGVRASEVAQQISNGAKLVDDHLKERDGVSFLPLLLHRGGNAAEFRVLKRLRVQFGGKNYPISTAKCGSVLRDLLSRIR